MTRTDITKIINNLKTNKSVDYIKKDIKFYKILVNIKKTIANNKIDFNILFTNSLKYNQLNSKKYGYILNLANIKYRLVVTYTEKFTSFYKLHISILDYKQSQDDIFYNFMSIVPIKT